MSCKASFSLATLVFFVCLTGDVTAVTITVDNYFTESNGDTAGAVGQFAVQTFTPSIAGQGVNDTVGANSPLPAGVGLQSVSFLKAVSGAATAGQLFIDVYEGSGDTGVYLGSSTNSIDVEAATGLDVLTWNFPDLFMDSAAEHALVWSTDNLAGSTVLARIQVARDSGGGFGSSYSGGASDDSGDGLSPLAFDTRFQVTMTDEAVDPGAIEVTINRTTGNISLSNSTVASLSNIVGYSILSDAGALTQAGWDQQSTGSQLANDDDQWTVLTAAGATTDLSEAVLTTTGAGNGGDLVASTGVLDFGDVWRKGRFEDISMELLVDDGSDEGLLLVSGTDFGITYTGAAIDPADLDGNGVVNTLDWVKFKSSYGSDVTGMNNYDAYYNGSDINGDGFSDQRDFVAYRLLYAEAQLGAAAVQSSAVPEPAAWSLTLFGVLAIGWRRRMKTVCWRPRAAVLLTTVATYSMVSTSSAQITVPIFLDDFQSYAVADPADFTTGANNWVHNGNGTAPNTSRIFATGNFGGGGQQLWIASAANAAAGTGINSTSGIPVDANTDYVFSAALVSETSNPDRTASGTYDLLIGATLGTASSVIGGPKSFTARGDDEAGGEDSYDDQLTVQEFNSGTVGGADRLFISIAFDGTDATNPFVGIDDVSVNAFAEIGVNVNTVTGAVTLFGDPNFEFDITSYSLTSGLGQLVPANLASLESKGIGDTAMTPDDGVGFELLDTPDMSREIAEADLTGFTTFDSSTSYSLGQVFNTGTPESDRDLQIVFTNLAGDLLTGTVNYIDTGALLGDYNGNGIVDAADYTVWRDNLGAGDEAAFAPGSGNGGGIDATDYDFWRNRYGSTLAPTVGSAEVPEPSVAVLALIGVASALGITGRGGRKQVENVRLLTSAGVPIVAWAVMGSAALATVTNDRTYLFGDPGSADAVSGANVGEGNPMGFSFGGRVLTADEVGPSGGGFADLQVFGPRYTSSTSRTGASSTFAASFNGSSDYLIGDAAVLGGGGLGFPGNDPPQNPVVVYEGIFSRGIQGWVRPTSSGSNARQDIVNDTYQFGIHINETDRWGVTYGATAFGSTAANVFESEEPVGFGEWSHVMQHSFGAGGFALYVNGRVVLVGGNLFGDSSFYHPHAVDADLDMTLGADLDGSGNFFAGAIDDLSVYVAGDNSGVEGGMDYGTFNVGTDNEYIAGLGLVPGDATGEGSVDSADVTFFVDHWLARQEFNGVAIGDLNSRTTQADFNFDGVTDLRDAFILNRALQAAGAPGLDFGLLSGAAGVPEPATCLLVFAGTMALGSCRWDRR